MGRKSLWHLSNLPYYGMKRELLFLDDFTKGTLCMIALVAAVVVLAAEVVAGVPVDVLLQQYGIVGVILVLLFTGRLALGRELKGMKEERDRYRQANEQILNSLSALPNNMEATLSALELIKDTLIEIQAESRHRRYNGEKE